MDAADYRGSTAGSVLDDLCERTGGVLNWFLFWNPDTSAIELFIKREQYTIGQCTLSISQRRERGRRDHRLRAGRRRQARPRAGPGRTPRSSSSTATARRSTARSTARRRRTSSAARRSPGRTRSARAPPSRRPTSGSLAHSYERDRITCTMRSVPASLVGLVQAGMGIDVKFSHFDVEGYADAPVTMRIVMCSPVPVSDIGDLYDISLELARQPRRRAAVGLTRPDAGCDPASTRHRATVLPCGRRLEQ